MSWGEIGLAEVSLATGDAAQAEVHYRSALQLALDAAAFPKALTALMGLAVLRAQSGDREGARKLARQVLLHPATTEIARARAAEILRMVDLEGADQPVATSSETFEEIVHNIIVGSPTGSD
jgi:hypothetical protein